MYGKMIMSSSVQIKEARLSDGFKTAFVNSDIKSEVGFRSEFIYNDYRKGRKVLSSLEDELRNCDSFCFSVAFITMGGITPLLQTLQELEKKGVKGRILTTDYLTFTDPKALRKLNSLTNIEIKMFSVDNVIEDFHTKGYIFESGGVYRIIVGSSNITHNALTTNHEWNSKIVSTARGEYAESVVKQFELLWSSSHSIPFDSFIDAYETRFRIVKEQQQIVRREKLVSIEDYKLQPNNMQVAFVKNIDELRKKGETRALLISATGTGKTYASAFALRDIDPSRALFIVHREQIARQAMESFKRVFQGTKTFGLLSGNCDQGDADIVFATMQMMAKENVRTRYGKKEFDTIVIDEAHRTGAESYHKIIDYFEPSFWLGMTASPDRMDGFDVYSLFHHNIACEIRLQQALEDNLLCPFHYFGITDIEFEDDHELVDLKDFNRLLSNRRVDYIEKQIEYYGFSGDRAKGLVFCSSIKEASELSKEFNRRGYKTISLSGSDNQETRQEAVERLAKDEGEDILQYIFTVDIFNEGVDVPEINQVIMLRPTESPIIFVQQLGRGLRKAKGKEYVVILDFIGNYNNNFMIPIALSGDRTYNKDNVRRYVMEGERVIPGASTIHFDEIAKKKIFASIDQANFSDLKLIRESYTNLKNKLGRIPSLVDFDLYGEIDPLRIFEKSSLGSYYAFLKKYEKGYDKKLSSDEEEIVSFVSQKLANGKRIQELLLLKKVIENHRFKISELADILLRDYGVVTDEAALNNIVNVMTNSFPTATAQEKFKACVFFETNSQQQVTMYDDYTIATAFEKMLDNKDFVEILTEVVDFGIARYERDYQDKYKDTDLVLYKKYTYEDVCRLLRWEHNINAQSIGGYFYHKSTKTYPVFINYEKPEDIGATTDYEDRFINPQTLIAISKNGRNKTSPDVQNFLHSEELGIDVELFVRKNKDDKISKEFYYLGRMKPTGKAEEFKMKNTNKTAVEIEWRLDTPVQEDIFQYIAEA